jgi:hypothetical protein
MASEWWSKDIREVVALPEWQDLRVSFLNTWKKDPEGNVKKLRQFLGPVADADDRKLRIVYNYLTGSGFRMYTITHPEITTLLEEVRAESSRRKQRP